MACAVAAVADFLAVVGQVHPSAVVVRFAGAAGLLQQLRYHEVVIQQRGVVLLAEVAHPGRAAVFDEAVFDGIDAVVEGVGVLGKAQAVVRVRAHQMDHDELALGARVGKGFLHAIEDLAVERGAGAARRAVHHVDHVGIACVLLLDGQVVVVADPPDLVAGGARQGQQVGRAVAVPAVPVVSIRGLAEMEHVAQRGQGACVH
ncbi:hypothetical protein D9M68_815490 [compost metagenome]